MKEELKKLAVIEAPFDGNNSRQMKMNVLYARASMHDALLKGYYPFMPQLMYFQKGLIDITNKEEVSLAREACSAWESLAPTRLIYKDRGITEDMMTGIENSKFNQQDNIFINLENYRHFIEGARELLKKVDFGFKNGFKESTKINWPTNKKALEKLTVVESPFRGEGYHETEINYLYTLEAAKKLLNEGFFPYASHLTYTQDGILDDRIKEERDLGIHAGILWGSLAPSRTVFSQRGISKGMELGIEAAKKQGIEIREGEIQNYNSWLNKLENKELRKEYHFKPFNGNFSSK